MLTSNAIDGFKKYTQNNIAFAKFKVGSTYYQVDIHKKEVLSDGRLAVYVLIDDKIPGDITISEIQLYDIDSKLWLTKTENISKKAVQEGILYRFTFEFEER
ncbi:hypothetical protein Q428_08645 [Fervidicella metallireducens AeB]|uniref:Uncharacterized protein n=1 Tax=Fervidicella metallireducens AeB TaxID=1403537 RepID=A0A017RU08_9CLOT|nr:hypothetical protein [Fervidicella metallireducens]EYE88258.1 hypothetical protein Q428_08645 [Fervidicella metallireducens AeB]